MNKQFFAIIRREFFYMWRDKGLRNILLFVPLLGLLLFSGIYSVQTLKDIPAAIVDLDQSTQSRELIENMKNAENLKMVAYPSSYKELQKLIEEEKTVVGIVIPENFGKNVTLKQQTRLLVIIDGSNMAYATNASSAVLTVTETISARAGITTLVAGGMGTSEAADVYQPIECQEEPWFNPTLNYAYFLVLGLAVNMWQQCCMLVSCINVIGETGMKSWLQVKASGISKLILFSSKSLAHIISFMGMIIPVYLLAFLVFKLPLACSFGTLLLFTLVSVISIHSVGTLMSSVAVNAVDSTRLGMMIALPSFVLSGFTWPIEAMPDFLQSIVWLLPQTWFFQGINYLTFKNPGWDFMMPYFASLLLIAVVCYGASSVIISWMER